MQKCEIEMRSILGKIPGSNFKKSPVIPRIRKITA